MENGHPHLARHLPDHHYGTLAPFAHDCVAAAAAQNAVLDARCGADHGLGGLAFFAKTIKKLAKTLKKCATNFTNQPLAGSC